MTATPDSHDEVPTPVLETRPEPAEDAYSASEEEEIAERLEALGYLE
ncbi:MAG TPA: hypothetical protein VFA46_10225 [Actinomycetes bacterium]|jgi:hypothetical protein|nr:hypothetical protein [Actinomycetes bacterium]